MSAGEGPTLPADAIVDLEEPRGSTQATARRALAILLERPGFRHADPTEKLRLAEAFASRNRPVYGQAFDAVHLASEVDLRDVADIKRNLDRITLYEVKATNRSGARDDFSGHFFSMSTAELLVAQKLGRQFRFAFVNVNNGRILDLSLQEVYTRSKAIYPTWSIRF